MARESRPAHSGRASFSDLEQAFFSTAPPDEPARAAERTDPT